MFSVKLLRKIPYEKKEELDIRLENFGFYKRICCYTMLVSHESVFNS
jgi:DNA-directed RNA polymerase subunit N (RpoN/RPB10)